VRRSPFPKKNTGDSTLKKPASATGEVFWKYVYVLLCVILLCLTAGQLFSGLSNPDTGRDYRVYKGAVQSLNHGEDPYFLLNINQYTGDWLPFLYPPHTLLFFWCLQFFFIYQSIWIYYAFLVAFMVASGYLIVTSDKKPQYLFFITLLLTAFMSTYWNFVTGNKDILFLFLFAVIFYLLIKEKFWQSSIVMGLMGSFSLITLPFITLYLVVRRSVMDRFTYILLSIGVVVAIFLITWWVNPSLLVSYCENILGSKSPLYERSGRDNPTPFLMFGVLLNQTDGGITIPLILISLVYVCLIIGASWYMIRKNQEKPLIVYCFVMLSIFMVLPRIKYYDFIILVLPIYFLFKDYGYKVKIIVLMLMSLLPLLFWYYPSIINYYPEIFRKGSLPYMIFVYTQTVSIFLIFIIILALEYFKPVSLPPSHS
jgi:hypothetical protein